jgi:WD40 repeat protein/serine/threonine protein kinase
MAAQAAVAAKGAGTMNEETIFEAAIQKPDPAERAAYLEGACGGDPELRRRVEALVCAHQQSGGLLDPSRSEAGSITAAVDAPFDHPPLVEGPGARIGPYKLREQIGEGGMGAVYVAEQQHPVRRKVALKIIKPGMDSAQVIARFEAERQALALMDHQNIARVLDAGTTGEVAGGGWRVAGREDNEAISPSTRHAPPATHSGRPYFVMELVHGVPITQFCDANQLTPRQRLELFIPVCRAIQHAHQKGIIHRDIKPSNVLVTMYDDKPVPKVIDFGVAKATEQRLTEKTVYTQFGALVGTFEYMSPEQAEMNAFGVDTRSDVYSLGVLLYELLTGTTPLGRERLRTAALHELVRLIKEEEAPRPSARLSGSDLLPKIAAARKTEPDRLPKLMRGELDWIVMKCLEKDRARRYETASGLARDVEHYLADEPVEACPPTAGYRLRKFARKHRTPMLVAGAFVLLLALGAIVAAWQAVRATSAEKVSKRAELEAKRAELEANQQRVAAEVAKQQALEAMAETEAQRDEARLEAYASGMGLAQRAWEESNVVRARELLAAVPKEVAGRNLRGFEWFYLSRLCHPAELTLEGHAGWVSSVAFSPDGQRLASGSSDKTLKVWDSATGKELFALKGHGGVVTSVAFSPDGQRLASASIDQTVKIWDSATGKELSTLRGHAGNVWSVAFSPNGQRLASASLDLTVKIWDTTTGKELLTLKGHANAVGSVTFSPDGQRLASAGMDQTVKIWECATGKELLTLKGHAGFVGDVAFSPDGGRLASGSSDQTVKIWDSATGEELFTLKGHAGSVRSVAFSQDGQRLASASHDQTVKIWDGATGRQLLALKGHAGWVEGVAFSPDGQRLASAGFDQTVKIWDSAADNELFTLKGHRGNVWSVAFSPDGQRLASGSADKTVKIWDSATVKVLFILNAAGPVSRVAFSPDGQRLVSGSVDQTVKIWDSATGTELFALKGHAGVVLSVAFSPDGQRLASASGDQTVKIWDGATGKELLALKGHAGAVGSVAFSPDGQRLASAGKDQTVKIWDGATGKELLTLKGHAGRVHSVAFSPDGQRLASGSSDQTVKIWDCATGKELFALKGHAGDVYDVAFSPDGQRLASASDDQTVRIWDSATGKELVAFKGHAGPISEVAFSPDGKRLASANQDGSIHLWETSSVSREVQHRRATNQTVADLFGQMSLRADVLERLRTLPGMSPSRRHEVLAVAQTYPEDSSALDVLARQLVWLPGGEMSGFRKALRYSEEACQLEPESGDFQSTLGVAYYRVGNYEKALDVLSRSDKINAVKDKGSRPTDLAFIAMAHHQLGQTKEAEAKLQLLRERMKDPRWAANAQAQGFLHEAEELLAKLKPPSSK